MFTKEDILARLQNGDSMDEIAKEMSDALNAAQADYESAIQADAEANRVREAKRQAVDMILDGMCDYLVASGKDKFIEDMKDIDIDDVIDMLDSAIELGETLDKLKDLEFVKMPVGLKFPIAEHKCGSGDCGCNNESKVTLKASDAKWDPDLVIKSFLKGI